jgi:hypothetical protein
VVVAVLGTGCSVIFPSLMIGIDQSIVSERRKTFGELIDGVLLYVSVAPAAQASDIDGGASL